MCGGNSRANSAQSRPAALSWRRSGSGERLATCGAALSWWGGSCWHRWRLLVLWPLHCAQGSPNSKLPRPDSVVPCLKSPKLDDHFGISHINLMLSQQLSYIKKGPQVKKYKWAENIYKYQPLYHWIYHCKHMMCILSDILCVCMCIFHQIFIETLLSPLQWSRNCV